MAQGHITSLTPHVTTALADLARLGDRAAFTRLYTAWHPRLLRYALRRCGDMELARDAMQDAGLTMARNIHRLKDPASFSPWAYTIVRRRVADLIRGRPPQSDELDPEFAESTSAFSIEERLSLQQVLSKLAGDDRLLLMLFYADGLTGAELSAALGIPAGTVKSRLHRIRETFKSHYTKNGDKYD